MKLLLVLVAVAPYEKCGLKFGKGEDGRPRDKEGLNEAEVKKYPEKCQ